MKKILTLAALLFSIATAFATGARPDGPAPECYPCGNIVSK